MVKKQAINIDLGKFNGGAVQEKFERALAEVVSNIENPNTDPKKKRKISLTVTMTPTNENRDTVSTDIDVKTTLAPETGVSTTLLVGMENGKPVANELLSSAPGQTFIDPETGEIKTDIGKPVLEVEAETKETNIVNLQQKG